MSEAVSTSLASSSAASTIAAGTTNAPSEHQQGGGGSGLLAERKGRFRVKQVEAAEAEEASYPEGDILGGRIKGFDRPHSSSSHHQHQHETSSSGAPQVHLSSHRMGTVDMSTVSDLTDSLGKSSKMGGEKKGRFTVRELPEIALEGSGVSTPIHHMEGHPPGHHSQHPHHLQQHPHQTSNQGGHGGNHTIHGHPHSRPPPHPHGGHHHSPHHQHTHHHSLMRASSAQHLDIAHTSGGGGGGVGGSSLRSSSSALHLEGSGETGHGHRGQQQQDASPGMSASGGTYAPHFQFASSTSLHDTGIGPSGSASSLSVHEPEYFRLLRQQNEMILSRLAHMERSFHPPSHPPSHPPTTPGVATTPGGTGEKGGGGGGSGGGPGHLSSGMKSGAGHHHHDAPSSLPSSAGPGKDIGAGKLTYLLEQMKIEVEAAVSRRKEVDLQMKRLQEKNRALEEKIDEERRKRVDTEKRFEKMKEKCEGLAEEVGHLRGSGGGGGGGGGANVGWAGPMGGKDQQQSQQQLQQQQQQQPQQQHLPLQPSLPHSAGASPSSTPPKANAFPAEFLQQPQQQNPFTAPIPITTTKVGIINSSSFNSNSSAISNSPDDVFTAILKPPIATSGSSTSLAVPPRVTKSPGPSAGIGLSSAANTPVRGGGEAKGGNNSSTSSTSGNDDPFDGLLKSSGGGTGRGAGAGGGSRTRFSSDVVRGSSSSSSSNNSSTINPNGGKQPQPPQPPQGPHGRRGSNFV
ncbi:hypothetical protein VYU27_005860 [Nannochloropsis oceanica]